MSSSIAMLARCMQRQDPAILAEFSADTQGRGESAVVGHDAEGFMPVTDHGLEGVSHASNVIVDDR